MFDLLARVGGAPACANDARRLIDKLPDDPYDAALRIKRALAARGFRDDARAFALPDMLARRAGNCLGLTLFVGAALIERGHAVMFEVRLAPLDDVHDAGAAYFARLCSADRGVDTDSRLPDARDRRARGRFVPVEHASIVLPDGRPFETTNLNDLETPPGWAPSAETVRRISFSALAASVYVERAKIAARENRWHAALALALRCVRGDPAHREAWVEVWQAARIVDRPALAAAALARHSAIGGDDSLFHFTRYRTTGDREHLDRALHRLPAYADAYLARHVVHGDGDDDDRRKHLAIVAWLYAGSEVLDLAALYDTCGKLVEDLFSREELSALRASFAPAAPVGGDSPDRA